jgi:hypothetical protein
MKRFLYKRNKNVFLFSETGYYLINIEDLIVFCYISQMSVYRCHLLKEGEILDIVITIDNMVLEFKKFSLGKRKVINTTFT